MKEHELKADKEKKEKLDLVRRYGCSLCHTDENVTLHRYGKGYICDDCFRRVNR